MRFGVFVVLFAVLLAIAAAITPASMSLPGVPGSEISPLATSECWTISYAAGFDTTYLPHTLRLDPDTIARFNGGPPLYRASGDVLISWRENASWRHAGPDSIDVTAHHAAIFRIPRGTRPRVGRVQPFWNGSVLMGWLAPVPKSSPVTVQNAPCTDPRVPPA